MRDKIDTAASFNVDLTIAECADSLSSIAGWRCAPGGNSRYSDREKFLLELAVRLMQEGIESQQAWGICMRRKVSQSILIIAFMVGVFSTRPLPGQERYRACEAR